MIKYLTFRYVRQKRNNMTEFLKIFSYEGHFRDWDEFRYNISYILLSFIIYFSRFFIAYKNKVFEC
jgi:hypothetical protein